MKKQILIIVLSVLISFTTQAQLMSMKKYIYNNTIKLKSTKLMIAIDEENQPELLERFKSGMEKFWTYTSYEFINPNEVEKYIKNKNYSVLVLLKYTMNEFMIYNYSIILGNEENKSIKDANINIVADVNFPNIPNKNTQHSLTKYDYLTPFFIRLLDCKIKKTLNKDEKQKIKRKGKAFYFDDGFDILHKKEKIFINESGINKDFDLNKFCKIFALSPVNVKIVNKEEIEKIIDDQDESVAFVYDYSFKGNIYDAKTAKLLSSNDTSEVL